MQLHLELIMISSCFLSLLALLYQINECKPQQCKTHEMNYNYSIQLLVLFVSLLSTDPTTCSNSEHNTIRLFNTLTDIVGDGSVQICYSGTWYAECDYGWDCTEANVACRQLGYDKASKLP